MNTPSLLVVVLLALGISPFRAVAAAPDTVIYDFEGEDATAVWSNLELPEAKEPAARWERSTEHVTSGAHSLRVTLAGGRWPTLTTTRVPGDWLPFQSFKADVHVERPCVVGFTALLEKSERGSGWDALVSRWTKTVFLQPGNNRVFVGIPQPNEYGISARRGKVVRFEVFVYQPHDGESVFLDNVRLSTDKVALPAKTQFTLAGTDVVLGGSTSAEAVIELGKKLKDTWTPPEPRTVAGIETAFRERFAALKKDHPGAVLVVLRDGEKGFDPADPDKPYSGWKDAYWNSHGPDSAFVQRAENRGKAESHEVFMRHRSPLMRVHLSSIPVGSSILAARLVLVRAVDAYIDDRNPEKKPTMWVVEPCNRPWEEQVVNAFQYARDRFWKEIGGMSWGDDPDFLPTFLAYGPGQGKVTEWDFTEAVRHWTDGRHPNHGFMLHGDSNDYIVAHSREAKNIADRPAVLVIYVPKAGAPN